MHSFPELVERSAKFTLHHLSATQDDVVAALQTSARTSLVKTLQMIQLQKVIMAVGMFSIFEALLQDRLKCTDGFKEAREYLEQQGATVLNERFADFQAAINVLKHGHGVSYNRLLAKSPNLPFRLKQHNEAFFREGDISEVESLIKVDDQFVIACAEIIRDVSDVIRKARPDSYL